MKRLTMAIIVAVLFGVLMTAVTAQGVEATAEVIPLESVSGAVIVPPDSAATLGLISIGQIDGNTLILSGFVLIGMMVMSLLAVGWMAIRSTRDNTSTEAIDQILTASFKGMLDVWDKIGSDVTVSPTKTDDALYAIADIPVEALTEYLKKLGLEVRPAPGVATNGEDVPF